MLILLLGAGVVGIISNSFIIAKGINIRENYFERLEPEDGPEHGLQVADFEHVFARTRILIPSEIHQSLVAPRARQQQDPDSLMAPYHPHVKTLRRTNCQQRITSA